MIASLGSHASVEKMEIGKPLARTSDAFSLSTVAILHPRTLEMNGRFLAEMAKKI